MNKYLAIGLSALLVLASGLTIRAERIEKEKIIISNDFVVVSNATFNGSVTIGGETRTNFPQTGILVSRSGDTNTLDFSEATKVLIPSSSESNSAVTRKELYDLGDSLSVLNLFGATNNNPIYSGYGSLWTPTIPEAWIITTNLVNGTNVVGIFWMTNYTDRIRQGSYDGRFFAKKVSGNSSVRGLLELIYTDDVLTTNTIATSSPTDLIITGIASYWLNTYNRASILGTNLVLGVRFSLIRSDGTAASVKIYGGTGYNTQLATPGVGNIVGYATTADVANWSINPATSTVTIGTNAVSFGTNAIKMFGGVLNGTNGVYWTCGTNDYWILFQ